VLINKAYVRCARWRYSAPTRRGGKPRVSIHLATWKANNDSMSSVAGRLNSPPRCATGQFQGQLDGSRRNAVSDVS